jgi:hypothetical protein
LSEFIKPSNDSTAIAQNKKDFDNYVADFCNGFADVLPQRTVFVEALKEIDDL